MDFILALLLAILTFATVPPEHREPAWLETGRVYEASLPACKQLESVHSIRDEAKKIGTGKWRFEYLARNGECAMLEGSVMIDQVFERFTDEYLGTSPTYIVKLRFVGQNGQMSPDFYGLINTQAKVRLVGRQA